MGINLLHPNQKFFAYGSMVTDDDEARNFVIVLVGHRLRPRFFVTVGMNLQIKWRSFTYINLA